VGFARGQSAFRGKVLMAIIGLLDSPTHGQYLFKGRVKHFSDVS